MMPPKFPVFLGALAVLFFSACQPRVETAPPHMLRETIPPEYLLQSLLKRQAEVKTLKSFIHTTVEKDHFKQTLRQTVFARGSDSIRVDTFGLFGQALGVFIHDGGQTLLYDTSNNRIYRDAEVWDVMDDVIGMAIDFKEIVSVFSGNIPGLDGHRVTRAQLEPEKRFYRLETLDSAGAVRFEIEMDAVDLLPAKWVKVQNGRKIYTVLWSDYRPVEDRPFPHRLVIMNPARREELLVDFQSPQVNKEIPADAFELPGRQKARPAESKR